MGVLPRWSVALAAAVMVPAGLAAQGAHEIEVYGAATALPGFIIGELQGNYVVDGHLLPAASSGTTIFDPFIRSPFDIARQQDPTCFNPGPSFVVSTPSIRASASPASGAAPIALADSVGCRPQAPVSTAHTANQTLELTAGITGWSEVAVYLFGTRLPGSTWQLSGASARLKLQAPAQWRWPFGVAISTEFEHERSSFSANTWSWEIRPIIDRAAGRWYVSLNPTVTRVLQGPGVANGIAFVPSAKVSYDLTRSITPGIEYYGAFGQIGAFAPANSQVQEYFGAVDLHLSPAWEINFGLGLGTTSASDQLLAKVIVGRRFAW